MPMNRQKIFKLAKGYDGRGRNVYSVAIRRVEKGLQYQYRDRRVKKREARKEWILSLNAGARQYGLTYSKFINALKVGNVKLDRKVLSDLAANEPYSFKSVVEYAKQFAKAPSSLAFPTPPPPPKVPRRKFVAGAARRRGEDLDALD